MRKSIGQILLLFLTGCVSVAAPKIEAQSGGQGSVVADKIDAGFYLIKAASFGFILPPSVTERIFANRATQLCASGYQEVELGNNSRNTKAPVQTAMLAIWPRGEKTKMYSKIAYVLCDDSSLSRAKAEALLRTREELGQ